MIITERVLAYGTGELVVRDYGGDGPAVLFVHGAGFCAAAWDVVARSLEGRVRAFALDLPGHGGSTAEMRRASDAWSAVVAASRGLGLQTPLLVGLAQGSHAALAATLEAPGEFAGVVTLGGACVRTRQNAVDDITFYTSPEFTELLTTRFSFGYRGSNAKDADLFVDHMVTRLARDWRTAGYKGLAAEVRYSLRAHPEGGWVNLPVPSTITTMMSMKPEHPYFPDESLYRHITVPVQIVQLADGLDQEHARRERDLAVSHPLVSVRALDAGDYPHYTRHHEVAAIISEACGVAVRPHVGDPAPGAQRFVG